MLLPDVRWGDHLRVRDWANLSAHSGAAISINALMSTRVHINTHTRTDACSQCTYTNALV